MVYDWTKLLVGVSVILCNAKTACLADEVKE